MAGSKTGWVSLAVLIMVLMVISSNGVWAQEEEAFAKLCQPFVAKRGVARKPSPGCCNVIRKLDLPSFCGTVPPYAEQYISMQKFINAARSCGIAVRRGLKCGSYTVPRRLAMKL